jgi:pilus assembly protein CpaC
MRQFLLGFFVVFAASVSGANAASMLDVGVNRAELVTIDGQMTEVIVANPVIADVVVHSSNKISVIGKKIGTTNVRFFSKGGKVLKEVDVVVGYDMPNIRRKLKEYYPDLRITVDTLNNSLAVAGTVPDSQTANRVMQIVYEFVKESRETSTATSKDFTEQDNRFPGVVNLLSLNSSQQVMLKVRIGELKRTALKRLGLNVQATHSGSSGGFTFATGAGQSIFSPAEEGSVTGTLGGFVTNAARDPFGTAIGTIQNGNFGLSGMLDMLEQDGLFKLLAERGVIDLKVFYTWGNAPTKLFDKKFGIIREWDIPLTEGYDFEMLHNFSPLPDSNKFLGIFNMTNEITRSRLH